MLKLLFLIYLADMSVFLRFVGIFGILFTIVYIAICYFRNPECLTKNKKFAASIMSAIFIVFVFTPTTKTLYLWAALSTNENIEVVGNTDLAKKAVDLLHKRIEKALD
ncbi:hypothetical protein ACHJH3_06800 [Campylobacter sp. MOP7]|uniref:hypothetical protein n=1 Tax=Campylobacter canis TaxID=3378588 RepID=UPI00387E7601